MDILRPLRKCFVCKSRKNLKRVIEQSYPSSDQYYYYHTECLQAVTHNPETYGHLIIDRALNIIDCLEAETRRTDSIIASHREKIFTLQRQRENIDILLQETNLAEAESITVTESQVRNSLFLSSDGQYRGERTPSIPEKKQEPDPEPGPSRYDLLKEKA